VTNVISFHLDSLSNFLKYRERKVKLHADGVVLVSILGLDKKDTKCYKMDLCHLSVNVRGEIYRFSKRNLGLY